MERKLSIILSKHRKHWKIKQSVKVSLPVSVYHNFRKNQAKNFRQLTIQKTLLQKAVPKQRNRKKLMNANRKRVVRRRIRKAINIQAAERGTQNTSSLVNNPNIAIGIVSLLQPDAIASILRQNNVEIPLSSLNNSSNVVTNTNVDINNNNRSDTSNLEPSLNTRDDKNSNNISNFENIAELNTSIKNYIEKETNNEREVKAINKTMETQTDDVREDSVPREAPSEQNLLLKAANTHRDCPFQESIQSLSQLKDWNTFIQQTHMGQTHKDWFDPSAGMTNNAPVRNKIRHRRNKELMRYDADMLLTHHMMVNKTAGMSSSDGTLYRGPNRSGFASSEIPMPSAPVVPPMLMAPGYNTRSSRRLDPAYRFNNNIQVRSQNSSDMGKPRYRLPLPALHPYRPSSASTTMTSGTLQGNATTSRWQVPFETQTAMHHFAEAQLQQRTTELMKRINSARTLYPDPMAENTFINDPRRRNRK